jgi:outer membrane immunogenic protein
MKRVLVSALAFSALVAPAMAADLYVKAPPPPAPCLWCGFYIGATAGYDWTDNNSVNVVTTNTFINFPVLSALGTTAGPAAAVASTANIGAGNSGFTGGFEAGYNFQLAPAWVVGLETDIESLSSGGSAAITQVAPRLGFPGFNYTSSVAVSDHLRYLGTVRGRLGFLATPTVLAYVTGGFAYGGASSSTAISGAETPPTGSTPIAGGGNFSDTLTGWTIGGGVEWMYTRNWTFKAEYLHYDLGTATYSNGTLTSFVAPGVVNFNNQSSSSVTAATSFAPA